MLQLHFYQPGFTLLGGGLAPPASLVRPRAATLPSKVRWLQSDVQSLQPDRNTVQLQWVGC